MAVAAVAAGKAVVVMINDNFHVVFVVFFVVCFQRFIVMRIIREIVFANVLQWFHGSLFVTFTSLSTHAAAADVAGFTVAAVLVQRYILVVVPCLG